MSAGSRLQTNQIMKAKKCDIDNMRSAKMMMTLKDRPIKVIAAILLSE